MNSSLQRVSLILFGFSIAAVISLRLFQPVRERRIRDEFVKLRTEKLFQKSSKANSLIQKEEAELLKNLNRIKNLFKHYLKSSKPFLMKSVFNETPKENLHSLAIWQGDSMIVWENNPGLSLNFKNDYLPRETFFSVRPLTASLAAYDTLRFEGKYYIIKLSKIVEKFYKIENDYFEPVSLNEKFSELLKVETNLIFNPKAFPSENKSVYSFVIYNNYNNKIGLLNFEKPNVSYEIKLLRIQTRKVVSVLLVFSFILLLIVLSSFFRKLNGFGKVTVLIFVAIILRYLIYYVNLVSNFFKGGIASPQYFSSRFGGGIARNPLELFITIVFGAVISIFALKYFRESPRDCKGKRKWLNILSLILISAFLPLYFRGFAASIQSFIFSSSLQYFSQNSLFPGWIKIFMLFNLFLLGAGFFNFLIIFVDYFLKSVIKYLNIKLKYSKIAASLILLFSFSIFNLIYPSLLLPYYLKLILLVAALLVSREVFSKSKINYWGYLYLLICASVFSLIILSSFSGQYKKKSLKLAAKEMDRPKVNLYKFWIKQLLKDARTNNSLKYSFLNGGNLNAEAFKIWSNSPFQKGNVPISVSFWDSTNKIIGLYSYNIYDSNNLDYKILSKVNNNKDTVFVFNNSKIVGITKNILPRRKKLTMIVCVNSRFNKITEPKFVTSRRLLNKIRIGEKDLFAFSINGNKIINEEGEFELPKSHIKLFKEIMKGKNEAWTELKLNGNSFLIYLHGVKERKANLIKVIGLKESDLSLSWFYFVKLFFYHSLIILLIVLSSFIFSVVKQRKVKFNFRGRLITAFLIVALIPLIFLASYLRSLTYLKNSASVRENLKEKTRMVISYLQSHWDETEPYKTLRDASDDLRINYSLYYRNNLIYSTLKKYYDIDLLSSLLNYKAKVNIEEQALTGTLVSEKVEKFNYSSFYKMIKIQNVPFVLEVNNAFNQILLPMSGSDFDVFLFGIYSIAVIITLLFSALLANQISNPIHKLTRAALAVGQGDLDLRISENYFGEIGELIKGFNLMIERLKKSQREITAMEREIAWREMAKQVAHEIKNPLTPMKLNVQHLRAAFNDKAEDFEKIFFTVTDNLIRQIETLKKIATEFSRLAKMPEATLKELDLTKVVREITELYADENLELTVTWKKPVIIKGDEDNLRRTLINIVRNAIQAKAKKIIFILSEDEQTFILDVKDNGMGIESAFQNKIFEAEFTTKKEGMGMGLAIVKNILEEMNASISLLESSAAGTTFRIVFPKNN